MEYIIICESLVMLFFLCKLINAIANKVSNEQYKKPLKIDLREPFLSKKHGESEEERKARIILENINNYGTNAPQQEVK